MDRLGCAMFFFQCLNCQFETIKIINNYCLGDQHSVIVNDEDQPTLTCAARNLMQCVNFQAHIIDNKKLYPHCSPVFINNTTPK
jgi:hypothetical protein